MKNFSSFAVATFAILLGTSMVVEAAPLSSRAKLSTSTTATLTKSQATALPRKDQIDTSKLKVAAFDQMQDASVQRNACVHGYCQVTKLDKKDAGYTLKLYEFDISKLIAFTIKKYLTEGGNLTPRSEPKFGESGYYDTYYGRIDPSGERATLASFKTVNGFDDYTAITRARYINAYDLGFGRDMNCVYDACYVTNYSDPKGYPNKEVTVAMERRWRGSDTYVSFYVYDAAGNRINYAALDSEGPKAVPQSCFACHKGYLAPSGNPYGGSFLPFDINLLETWPGGGRPTKYDQMDELRQLNYMVWNDTSSPDGSGGRRNDDIASLIEEWYDGAPYSWNSYSDPGHAPKEWYSQVNNAGQPTYANGTLANCASSPMPQPCKKYFYEWGLYKNVYIKYCRSCHIAQGPVQDTAASSQGHVFKQASVFASFGKSYACSGSKSMPHAELTDDRFRTDLLNFTNGTSKTPEEILCNTTSP